MDTAEIKKFLLQDERGKALLEELKGPLIQKRDELLASLHEVNGRVAQAASRAADAEKLLIEERASMEKVVVDSELARILKSERVYEQAIPGIVQELKQVYGLQVSANGADRKACGKIKGPDGVEKEAAVTEIVQDWIRTDGAKAVIPAGNSGGGASGGSGGPGRLKILSLETFEAMPAADRAEFMRAGGRIA
jgi:hypothetical protein